MVVVEACAGPGPEKTTHDLLRGGPGRRTIRLDPDLLQRGLSYQRALLH